MSKKKVEGERSSIEILVDVPGTPEQVWQAIATGQGITSWLFPTEVEEREGGAVEFHIGPGMESSGTVTAWQPPHHFGYEEPNWMPEAPPLGTEFFIEAKAGGGCTMRLVHSLFGPNAQNWDDQFDSFEKGWLSHFRVLRLYLAHYFGLPSAGIRAMADAGEDESAAWDTLRKALGLDGAQTGEHQAIQVPGVAPLAGIVEPPSERGHANELTLRLEAPQNGVLMVGAYTWGEKAHASLGLFLYGDQAAEVAARDGEGWQSWLTELYGAAS
jgi:uncharacterized protein YndB with AHSA1/START domain